MYKENLLCSKYSVGLLLVRVTQILAIESCSFDHQALMQISKMLFLEGSWATSDAGTPHPPPLRLFPPESGNAKKGEVSFRR